MPQLKFATSAEPTDEHPVRLTAASRLFPSKPSTGTLWRWMQDGIIGPNGDRLKLRFLMYGKRRYIEPAAAREFIAACNAAPQVAVMARPGDASKALEKLGC